MHVFPTRSIDIATARQSIKSIFLYLKFIHRFGRKKKFVYVAVEMNAIDMMRQLLCQMLDDDLKWSSTRMQSSIKMYHRQSHCAHMPLPLLLLNVSSFFLLHFHSRFRFVFFIFVFLFLVYIYMFMYGVCYLVLYSIYL